MKPLRALAALVALAAPPAQATVVNVINGDSPGTGLNDTTPVAPVTGNPGTTRGQQRLNVFVAAAQAWASTIDSDVPIDLLASFDPLDCDASSAILGQAGPTFVFRDDASLPRAGTWYHAALAEAYIGENLTGGDGDIEAVFNSRLDDDPGCIPSLNWWYGIGVVPPAGTVDFYKTVLHELGHGLGFGTFVNKSTGEKLQGYDDVFMVHLQDGSRSQNWPALTNSQRAASATDDGDLLWTGARVVATSGFLSAGRRPDGRVQMYAPPVLEPGSSVSHFDTDVTPNDLMEPILNNDAQTALTVAAMQDVGWTLAGAAGPCVRDSRTACLLAGRFEVRVTYQTVSAAGDALVMSFGGARTESDQSVFFYFFDNANFEMGVKMVNACVAPFNKYWAFVSGLTNQGYTVTIRDSVTGATKYYSNPLGSYPQTVGDTSALECLGTGDPGDLPPEVEFVPVAALPAAERAPAGGDVVEPAAGVGAAALAADAASGRGGPAPAEGIPASGLSAATPSTIAVDEPRDESLLAGRMTTFEAATADNGLDIEGFWEWSISGGQTHIRADDVTNSRGTTSGPLRLTLWASTSPVTGGAISGYDLGHCNYSALPGGYYYPSLTCNVPYVPPPAGCYYVTILLMEQISGVWYYQDWVATSDRYALSGGSCGTTGSLEILGYWEWSINAGQTHIRADEVTNSRGTTTGPLRLELWASTSPVTGGSITGYDLGHCNYSALPPATYYPSLTCNTAYMPPAAGCYYVTILLMEQIDGTWYYQDWAATDDRYALAGGSCGTTGACVRSGTKACLLASRFEVTVTYQTATTGGDSSVMSFSGQRTESDQSVFFYFFDNANFEMGVKMVNACVDPFNRFWAFVSGLTNQGYVVTIRDTLTGRERTYSNPLGSYPRTLGDTDAFPCS